MRKALRQYQTVNLESDIESASPYRITQLLLEGCLRFMKQARFAIEKEDYEKKGFFISKSSAIILTLAGSIDREKSPELSDNLVNLYDFCLDRLLAASVEMNVTKIDDAIDVLQEIKTGWDAITDDDVAKAEMMRKKDG
ncbi:flagellar export chaperone FliS [Oceanospirillum beijerinckii]|uniref:flagellar export chaperone FliS n=1 Tax=Oceanospirillum beijerinckii TaxID=64976 RepID=UPI000418E28D|nr:flagellar export chaperone FliS [Oceanospirillum beijerinckii]